MSAIVCILVTKHRFATTPHANVAVFVYINRCQGTGTERRYKSLEYYWL